MSNEPELKPGGHTSFEMVEMVSGIATAVTAIIGELARDGIAKTKTASGYGAGYKFRGIDDVQAALAPLLAKHGVTLTPAVQDCWMSERSTSKGNTQYHALVRVQYTLRHTDGSSYSGVTYGEAADTGDKAVGKAMSYAFKSFCLQAFCVPTESTALDDPDATVHEPTTGSRKPQDRRSQGGPTKTATPGPKPYSGYDEAREAMVRATTEYDLREIGVRIAECTHWPDEDIAAAKEFFAERRYQIRGV